MLSTQLKVEHRVSIVESGHIVIYGLKTQFKKVGFEYLLLSLL
jgi:hypothetical protein